MDRINNLEGLLQPKLYTNAKATQVMDGDKDKPATVQHEVMQPHPSLTEIDESASLDCNRAWDWVQ